MAYGLDVTTTYGRHTYQNIIICPQMIHDANFLISLEIW